MHNGDPGNNAASRSDPFPVNIHLLLPWESTVAREPDLLHLLLALGFLRPFWRQQQRTDKEADRTDQSAQICRSTLGNWPATEALGN